MCKRANDGSKHAAVARRLDLGHIGLPITAAAVMAVVGMVLFVLSFITQGGMAQATADIEIGHMSSFRSAWAAGLHLFWRYVGLWLLLGLAAFAVDVRVTLMVSIALVLVTAALVPGAGVAIAAAAGAAVVIGFVTLVLNVTGASPPHAG